METSHGNQRPAALPNFFNQWVNHIQVQRLLRPINCGLVRVNTDLLRHAQVSDYWSGGWTGQQLLNGGALAGYHWLVGKAQVRTLGPPVNASAGWLKPEKCSG
ncbi:hypothetical protein [Lactiplantibacillus modestisalitolerans]|uniref:Uncharacterized protein n=1 Tax=Lactiplantibacillus modestisalitolerans TaxID=1457219 RepID=A0ABV5WR54_9LACO|nr:hypothetical protein [Lactiplantibacillus modestisalitolerans]